MENFINSADSLETSTEIMEAIAWLARDEAEAMQIWKIQAMGNWSLLLSASLATTAQIQKIISGALKAISGLTNNGRHSPPRAGYIVATR